MKTTIDFFPLLKWFKVKDCCSLMKNLVAFSLLCVAMSGFAHSKCESAFIGLPNDTIYGGYQVDKNPEYPGGLAECVGFINKNIDREKCEGKEGRVILDFVVNSDGSLSDINVLRGIGRKVDKEIVGIVKKMPKWNPGTLNGNPVRVRFTLPVMVKFGNSHTAQSKDAIRAKVNVVDNNWTGSETVRILVSYVVDEHGNVKNVLVREGAHPKAEQVAIREVKKLSKLTPTMKDNKPVSSERTIAVYVNILRLPWDDRPDEDERLEKKEMLDKVREMERQLFKR